MAKYAWPAGSTSKTTLLFIQDSASTTGAGRVSVSAGNINVQEIRVQTDNTVTRVTVSVTNLAALTDSYLAGGIFPVDPVNTPGWYRFDIPDTALSVGAVTAGISILGTLSASNIAQLALEIQLQNTPADATAWAGVATSTNDIALHDNSALFNALVGLAVNTTRWAGVSTSSNDIAIKDTLAAGTDITGTFDVNAIQWQGAATATDDIALFNAAQLASAVNAITVNVGTWAGASVSTNSIVFRGEISLSSVNVTAWAGVSVSASNAAVQNQPQVNVRQVQSISLSGSGTAGNPWVPIA